MPMLLRSQGTHYTAVAPMIVAKAIQGEYVKGIRRPWKEGKNYGKYRVQTMTLR
jgi:hypothetical protein